ncbi:hypothetical protein [Kribbella sp. DT2]|uniref:hypothetical protein n=1 Tax=Kribbella sp. DT2 TaxID=3393427 RepID=UPI003CEE67FD
MTDNAPPLPGPNPASSVVSRSQQGPSAPLGAAAALTDRILVHAAGATGISIAGALPPGSSGLVLTGKKATESSRTLHRYLFGQPVLIDPEGYLDAAATPEAPFVLPGEGLFPVGFDEVLQGQLDAGATAALTPTGYLFAGDTDALKAAINGVSALGRSDTILSLPLDVAWFNGDHIESLLAILSRFEGAKAVFLGGQFDPMQRYKAAVTNLRRLVSEAGHIAVLRTDLTAFDVMSHGAFAASIGTGGSLRHVIPFGQKPRSSKNDQSPSVLYGELKSFHKGSTLAERFANHYPPSCARCDSRGLDTFLKKADAPAAHLHGIHTWSDWAAEMRQQASLDDRAIWWRNESLLAEAEAEIVSARIEQDGAFAASATLGAWANLPTWPQPLKVQTV